MENIPPHGCKLLIIRPVTGKNQLLGTDIHYTSGGVEIEYLNINENIVDLKLVSHSFQQANLTFYHAQKDKAITLKVPINKAMTVNVNNPGKND